MGSVSNFRLVLPIPSLRVPGASRRSILIAKLLLPGICRLKPQTASFTLFVPIAGVVVVHCLLGFREEIRPALHREGVGHH